MKTAKTISAAPMTVGPMTHSRRASALFASWYVHTGLPQTFPGPLNISRCCLQPICTECFVQIQRVDPKHTVPPSSQPAMCPFCVTSEFGVVYDPPETTDASSNTPKSSAQTAIECAETAVGTGGASTNGRTSYPADHPRVVLVDTVHPDWHTKLEAALETQARQANRRMILRQVGDTLVPIGVSSSRTGETLANAVSHNARLGHNGPGGSIILHQNARVTDLELDGAAPRSSSLSSSLPGPLQRGLPFSRFRNSERRHHPQIGDSLARSVMHLTPYEMEQLVLHETLRISREEAEARACAEQADARAARTSASVPPRTTEQRSQRSPETRRSNGARRSPETRRTPRLSFDLSRFRSSSEQPRARSSLDTARAPHSPDARRTPHSPEARRAPSRAGAFDAADTVRAPSPIEEVVPTPGAAASEAAAPEAAAPEAAVPDAAAPSAAAPRNAASNASQSAAPPSLAPALVLQSPSPSPMPSALPRTSMSLDTDRAASPVPSQSPVAARAPVRHPATPDTQRARSASNTPVNLSKSVMDDLQQLSGNATPPARRSPSTNPFRRRMDAAAP